MSKPITEKDFERVADWYGIHPTVRSNLYKSMFEEGKKMAIDFAMWVCKDGGSVATINGVGESAYECNEKIFESYQQQKQ